MPPNGVEALPTSKGVLQNESGVPTLAPHSKAAQFRVPGGATRLKRIDHFLCNSACQAEFQAALLSFLDSNRLYPISESVTRMGFPNRGLADSRWRTGGSPCLFPFGAIFRLL